MGYSNGANIAASLLLTRPETLAGAILFRPMLPFEPRQPVDLAGKPIRISAGRSDQLIPRALTDRLAEVLTRPGAGVTMVWYDAGHSLIPREVAEAAEWFVEVVDSADGVVDDRRM